MGSYMDLTPKHASRGAALVGGILLIFWAADAGGMIPTNLSTPNSKRVLATAIALIMVWAVITVISVTSISVPIATHDLAREDKALERLSAEDRQLSILLEYNRQQVLRYHDIVTDQAARSFRAGQMASGAGLAVLMVCLWIGLTKQSADVKYFAGAIAAIGTAISAYINRTYMHMYEKSILQLSQYFDQPVITGYFLTAERMAKLDMTNTELRDRIVGAVLDSAAHISTKSMHADRRNKPEAEGSASE